MTDLLRSWLKTDAVLTSVRHERIRQDAQWSEQNHPEVEQFMPGLEICDEYSEMAGDWQATNAQRVEQGRLAWDGILLEEVYEALGERDPAKRRAELIQVAAVAVAMVEASDRKVNGHAA